MKTLRLLTAVADARPLQYNDSVEVSGELPLDLARAVRGKSRFVNGLVPRTRQSWFDRFSSARTENRDLAVDLDAAKANIKVTLPESALCLFSSSHTTGSRSRLERCV